MLRVRKDGRTPSAAPRRSRVGESTLPPVVSKAKVIVKIAHRVVPQETPLDLFAVCSPGLETFSLQELEAGWAVETASLRPGLGTPEQGPGGTSGGIAFRGTLPDLYRANLQLRTVNRVLVRLGDFPAPSFPELRRRTAALAWERFLRPGVPVALRVACHRSRLYHQQAVAERVVGAIGDRLGQAPPVQKWSDDEDRRGLQLVLVRVADNHCTVSLDSSGPLLHRRGYRLAGAKAPLRETLAAGLVLASGWDGVSPLLDPFCGSGTIPIEAALIAAGRPPGRHRAFAFMDWPGFERRPWEKILAEADGGGPDRRPRILASDRDPGAVQSARENADRAGVGDRIEFSCRPLSAVEPPPGLGWMVTNPPYGVRVSSGKDLRNLYAQMGNVLRARCPGWQAVFLCPSPVLAGHTGLRPARGVRLHHGGSPVTLWQGKVAS